MTLVSLCVLPGVLALGICGPVQALDVNGQFESPLLQTRFEDMTKELRCLVCQNESIADSNVPLASDLRRQVREMLIAGKTDRYGEFVRFSPPAEPKNPPDMGRSIHRYVVPLGDCGSDRPAPYGNGAR